MIAYNANAASAGGHRTKEVYNVYKDYPGGRQLSEPVSDFLARLPPYSTRIEDCGPWLYISNPTYNPAKTREDVRGFKEQGNRLLSGFSAQRADIEESGNGKSKSAITRKLNELRKQLQVDVFELARNKDVTAGKWMLFPSPGDVNRVWSLVANATANGELGHAAKVAANDGSGDSNARLVCVYNEDFRDKKEVKQVVQCLDRMGLIAARGIYYKSE